MTRVNMSNSWPSLWGQDNPIKSKKKKKTWCLILNNPNVKWQNWKKNELQKDKKTSKLRKVWQTPQIGSYEHNNLIESKIKKI